MCITPLWKYIHLHVPVHTYHVTGDIICLWEGKSEVANFYSLVFPTLLLVTVNELSTSIKVRN